MRFNSLFLSGLACALLSSVSASPLGDESEPEVIVTATFPPENPFGQIVNGQRNRIDLLVENKSEQNITLMTVAGSFHNPESNQLIKNASALNYGIFIIGGTKLQVPYSFHSEFKPGDILLNIWINHMVESKVYQVSAFEQVVTVVEPPTSIFHYEVLSTYLITAGFLGGLIYLAYLQFFPQPKKRSSHIKKPSISAPVGKVTATGAGGYEEEWIPEHHLKKTKSGKKKVEGEDTGVTSMSSGDELVASETRKRKTGKK